MPERVNISRQDFIRCGPQAFSIDASISDIIFAAALYFVQYRGLAELRLIAMMNLFRICGMDKPPPRAP